MEHWEIIFENGEMSVMSVDDKDKAIAGLVEVQRRAKSGEPRVLSDPSSGVGPRIKRVFVYDGHPDDLSTTDGISVDQVREALKRLAVDGVVSYTELAADLKPQVLDPNAGVHDTRYTAVQSEELDSSLWEGDK